MSYKIYTKQGDKGKTSIIGQNKIDKHDIRIEAYGSIDELNSYFGLLRSIDEVKNIKFLYNFLIKSQNNLFSKLFSNFLFNCFNVFKKFVVKFQNKEMFR